MMREPITGVRGPDQVASPSNSRQTSRPCPNGTIGTRDVTEVFMATKSLDMSRRDMAGAAALGGISFLARPQRVFGANDRVRVAICGIRGRGMDHARSYSKLSNVEIAAVCEIDENVAAQRLPAI